TGPNSSKVIDARINANNHFVFNPTAAGVYHFTIVARDGVGGETPASFTVTVNPPPTSPNQAPQMDLIATPQNVIWDQPLSISVTGSDRDGNINGQHVRYYL